ncbi:PP2C family protein-serine/threonine phosphatase [Roseibium suaedae]|uniref:Protein phosphatase/serine/threonine protein phosphatase Stp1 n=1 Tax=Roseibium suaedae TaxID=735517 RepID=A0A1M7P8X2_9HYPH|nr:protein phosphatase 2C domain-containing protein [Roseibium suaedae]SHN13128.1 protein phosphatase/serine/threonine protein phosphatase Stp1 [Roseibium suaedae]
MTGSLLKDTRGHSATTHTGFVRKVNEDAILARPDLGLWAVSDGMGGHAGGDYASQTVVDALNSLPAGLDPASVMQEARRALFEAHEHIKAEAHRRAQGTIGATVVLLVLSEQHFMCLWAGDSRLYRLRQGTLSMISFDHSVVGELVEQGRLTWDEAANCAGSNQITRAVGVGDELEIDKRRGDILPGDRFLLCSDGLSQYADEATLSHYLTGHPIETVADGLLSVALAGGASDNVSVIAVEV